MGTSLNILLSKFKPFNSTVFTGRPQGEAARKSLELDQKEDSLDIVNVFIPKDTTSLNPSFFLGLFYQSIKKHGLESFLKKFKFEFETDDLEIQNILQKNINDALRNAETSLNQNISL